jgi:transaldolase
MAAERVTTLLSFGAQVQRPLWASTSTKNPTYFDLLYVDSIVANETVNTMPDATLAGVLDHGDFTHSLLADAHTIEEASNVVKKLPSDVSLRDVTEKLEVDGVQAFVDAYEELLATVATKIQSSK